MPAKYHSYEEMTNELRKLNRKWPKLTKLYSLSEKTVSGKNLWVLQISTDVQKKERKELKPMVKYVANIHGNEAVGKELLLNLAKYFLTTYSSTSSKDDLEIKKLIDKTDIHILPSMNPDGFEYSPKKTCHNIIGSE